MYKTAIFLRGKKKKRKKEERKRADFFLENVSQKNIIIPGHQLSRFLHE